MGIESKVEVKEKMGWEVEKKEEKREEEEGRSVGGRGVESVVKEEEDVKVEPSGNGNCSRNR